MNSQSQYKLIIVGSGGVGKTTLVKQLITKRFEQKYVPTLGVEVHPFNYNNMDFNIWDCSGNENYSGLGEGYYVKANCAIILCDNDSFIDIVSYYKKIRRMCGNIPIVLYTNIRNYDPKINRLSTRGKYNEDIHVMCYNISLAENVNTLAGFKWFGKVM